MPDRKLVGTRGWITLATLAFLAALVAVPSPAEAAYPGKNGKIAFVRGDDIWTMNPDGSAQANLTSDSFSDRHPAWSPDGTKIAFDSNREGLRRVFVMNADGTGLRRLDECGVNCGDQLPSWSPDGTLISLVRCCQISDDDIVVVNSADGSGDTTLYIGFSGITGQDWSPDGTQLALADAFDLAVISWPGGEVEARLTDDENFNTEPSWSPDAGWIAFETETSPAGTHAIRPDGSGEHFIYAEFDGVWSPDGTKLAYHGVTTTNADGTGATFPASGSDPAWQPIPINSYPRPKGATPFKTSLVPAYKSCAASNRTHGPPLAFPSCNPPAMASDELTLGTPEVNAKPARSSGSVEYATVTGNPATPADEADVKITFELQDVYDQQTVVDYTGELRLHTGLRITDKLNTPHPGGPGAATVSDTTLGSTVSCVATADANQGATCSLLTSADALVPGTVTEGKRAVWSLGQVQVDDGGADGDADTAGDNTLFAVQGVFVP